MSKFTELKERMDKCVAWGPYGHEDADDILVELVKYLSTHLEGKDKQNVDSLLLDYDEVSKWYS